jgi:hypothetical protein
MAGGAPALPVRAIGRSLRVEFGRGGGKVFEERGAEPAFDSALGPRVPVAGVFFAAEDKPSLKAGEWLGGKREAKAFGGVGDSGGKEIEDVIGAGDEWFADETDAFVVEDPCAFESIGGDGED